MDINKLLRPAIRELKPYSSARDEFSGSAQVMLDANENPFTFNTWNRYPDPLQRQLKGRLSALKSISPGRIFVGNGSDEAIDLLVRAFCEPGQARVIITPPTYGMYKVAAAMNNVEVVAAPLSPSFELQPGQIRAVTDSRTKLLFICSPNNPTGNCMQRAAVFEVARSFDGLVVIDEAYVDFSPQESLLPDLPQLPNAVVLQTFSKAFGLAGARVGVAYGDPSIVAALNKLKPPYNVSAPSQQLAIQALENLPACQASIQTLLDQRARLRQELAQLRSIELIYPSDANFLLVKTNNADRIYSYLIERGIVARNRTKEPGCSNCVRITVGLPQENTALLNAWREYETGTIY